MCPSSIRNRTNGELQASAASSSSAWARGSGRCSGLSRLWPAACQCSTRPASGLLAEDSAYRDRPRCRHARTGLVLSHCPVTGTGFGLLVYQNARTSIGPADIGSRPGRAEILSFR
jgi:hypothetical protein